MDFDEPEQEDHFYGTLAYIPIAGPILVFLFYRDKRFAAIHAKNALYLQGTFVAVLLFIWLCKNLPALSTILKLVLFIPYITDAITYLAVVGFVLISLTGAWKAHNRSLWKVPLLNDLFETVFLKKNSNKKPINQKGDKDGAEAKAPRSSKTKKENA